MATITLEYNPRNRAVQKVLEAWIEEGIVQQLPTKSKDDSCMGRKEFYAAIDVAKAQARRGEYSVTLTTDEDISNYLKIK